MRFSLPNQMSEHELRIVLLKSVENRLRRIGEACRTIGFDSLSGEIFLALSDVAKVRAELDQGDQR